MIKPWWPLTLSNVPTAKRSLIQNRCEQRLRVREELVCCHMISYRPIPYIANWFYLIVLVIRLSIINQQKLYAEEIFHQIISEVKYCKISAAYLFICLHCKVLALRNYCRYSWYNHQPRNNIIRFITQCTVWSAHCIGLWGHQSHHLLIVDHLLKLCIMHQYLYNQLHCTSKTYAVQIQPWTLRVVNLWYWPYSGQQHSWFARLSRNLSHSYMWYSLTSFIWIPQATTPI